jgi:hypothetical protein
VIRRVPALLAAAALALACTGGNPCTQPLERCGNFCYDLRSDRQHCGACGTVCDAGQACVLGACEVDTSGGCEGRTGGAFVTLSVCGEAVKVWATAEAFVSRAEALVADPSSVGGTVARFELALGTDCDSQWTWHTEPATAAFLAAPDGQCDACPSEVEGAVAYWFADVGTWCPTPWGDDARVVAVDRR